MKHISLSKAQRITILGSIINIVLIFGKLIIGVLGSSHALIADAFHSASDLGTDIIVFAGLIVSRRPPDENHHYGHAAIESLLSLLVGIVLISVGVYIGAKAAYCIYTREVSNPSFLVLCMAGFSVIVKEMLYQSTIKIGNVERNKLLIANAWHHRSDSLSSIAVFVGVGGSLLMPELKVLDFYTALLVSFFVVKAGVSIFKESLMELIVTAPKSAVLEQIRSLITDVPGVQNVHSLRVRTLGGIHQMDVHVVVDSNKTVSEGHKIAVDIESALIKSLPEIGSIVVHVDPSDIL
jgi:cation diffusion facilitator family transporter